VPDLTDLIDRILKYLGVSELYALIATAIITVIAGIISIYLTIKKWKLEQALAQAVKDLISQTTATEAARERAEKLETRAHEKEQEAKILIIQNEDQKAELQTKSQLVSQQANKLERQQQELDKKTKEVLDRDVALRETEAELRRIRGELKAGTDVWDLRKLPLTPQNFQNLPNERFRVVIVGNQKGGVGKSTIAANLSASFADQGKRILLIDLDYQGSLTRMILLAANLGERLVDEGRHAVPLFAPDASIQTLEDVALDISTALRQKDSKFVAADYRFAALENDLFVKHIFGDEEIDPRIRLFRLLHSQAVGERFDIVIIDTPPRIAGGHINALYAATDLIVPTIGDQLSAIAVSKYIENVAVVRKQLPGLQLAGVVPTMTFHQDKLANREFEAIRLVENGLREIAVKEIISWKSNPITSDTPIQDRTLFPKAVAAGRLAYHYEENGDRLAKLWFDKLRDRLFG